LVRTFSPRLQELVGYGVYSGLIGHIDKKAPMQLLNNDGDLSMVWDAV
jgi:ectoine hydroxylase-related dioxygenase (phytanoyl-CoA dioxygenase family)